jgi:hypothetical protein
MGESFLDFMEEDLDGAVEPQAVEEGEYTIKLIDWKTDDKGTVLRKDRGGAPYILPFIEVIECEEAQYAKGFTHFLRIPHADMTVKEKNQAKWDLKAFFTCFGIDYSQRIDYEECIGSTGEALLVVTPDEGYGEQNRIKKFMSPR